MSSHHYVGENVGNRTGVSGFPPTNLFELLIELPASISAMVKVSLRHAANAWNDFSQGRGAAETVMIPVWLAFTQYVLTWNRI